MAISKIILNNEIQMDVTSDTVTADKLMQGYTAHDRTGALITGTAIGGGGSVTQDQDGFIILPPDGGGSPSASGLVYETGTWTPSQNASSGWISFANTHTVAPCFYLIWDNTGTYDSTTYSSYSVGYFNGAQFFGFPIYDSDSAMRYGHALIVYRLGTATTIVHQVTKIVTPHTDASDSSTNNSRYWAKETGIKAECYSTSVYWLAGRTYKWIAVWAPTT